MNISKQVIILNAVNNGDSIENQDLKNRIIILIKENIY